MEHAEILAQLDTERCTLALFVTPEARDRLMRTRIDPLLDELLEEAGDG